MGGFQSSQALLCVCWMVIWGAIQSCKAPSWLLSAPSRAICQFFHAVTHVVLSQSPETTKFIQVLRNTSPKSLLFSCIHHCSSDILESCINVFPHLTFQNHIVLWTPALMAKNFVGEQGREGRGRENSETCTAEEIYSCVHTSLCI